jgi:hypothetical protein
MKLIFLAAVILAVAFWIGAKAGHRLDHQIQNPKSKIQNVITEDLAR